MCMCLYACLFVKLIFRCLPNKVLAAMFSGDTDDANIGGLIVMMMIVIVWLL